MKRLEVMTEVTQEKKKAIQEKIDDNQQKV
jgi:hypothetical protein